MSVTTSPQSFQRLCSQIDQALAQENWEALTSLDAQCRQALKAAGEGQALSERLQSDPALGQALIELQHSYQALVNRCQQHRDDLREELVRTRQAGKAARAYSQT
ncbi:flagellar protein FliT [Aestuariirhabdus sp. Z084]|uniref:flagellar protein FliT n=1 Tax=Aestuariirhabdus haliotis TaxID=2918751 RepID=UPI00201B3F42|nr:flagellar protein FliT [Aestuariirhabdus haliotis]MCL6414456.1 flagellar protein FliT [Aestuariirhabdus haliotis]MCL6418562.1 flagellar protein FliT [Aestuariirhabdus haliotis]